MCCRRPEDGQGNGGNMGNQESKIQVREVELPAIEIRDLVKVYKLYDRARDRVKDAFGLSRHKAQKRHYALNGVNLCIRKGETVGIIGTNGSGKYVTSSYDSFLH